MTPKLGVMTHQLGKPNNDPTTPKLDQHPSVGEA